MNAVAQRVILCGIAAGFVALVSATGAAQAASLPPNIVFVIADQWRSEAFGYAGNPDIKTPNLDRLQREGIRFVNAVAGLPVCSPARASILTGQRPLKRGMRSNTSATMRSLRSRSSSSSPGGRRMIPISPRPRNTGPCMIPTN